MIAGVRIILSGSPERVHRVADSFEVSWPERIQWHGSAKPTARGHITIVGRGRPVKKKSIQLDQSLNR